MSGRNRQKSPCVSPVIKISISKSLLVSILAYGLFNLQIAVSELDPDCFRIDYSDPFNHLANDLVIIVRKAIEMFLQISCV